MSTDSVTCTYTSTRSPCHGNRLGLILASYTLYQFSIPSVMPFKRVDLLSRDMLHSLGNRCLAANHIKRQSNGTRLLDTTHNHLGDILSRDGLGKMDLSGLNLTLALLQVQPAGSDDGVIKTALGVVGHEILVGGEFLMQSQQKMPHCVAFILISRSGPHLLASM